MNITAVTPFVCHAYRCNYVFVKVQTDAGLHGWGEARVPIAAGERLDSRWDYQRFFDLRCADFAQPDVSRDARRDRFRDHAPAAPLVRVRHVETDTLHLERRPPIALKRDEQFLFNEDSFRELAVQDCVMQELPAVA